MCCQHVTHKVSGHSKISLDYTHCGFIQPDICSPCSMHTYQGAGATPMKMSCSQSTKSSSNNMYALKKLIPFTNIQNVSRIKTWSFLFHFVKTDINTLFSLVYGTFVHIFLKLQNDEHLLCNDRTVSGLTTQ